VVFEQPRRREVTIKIKIKYFIDPILLKTSSKNKKRP